MCLSTIYTALSISPYLSYRVTLDGDIVNRENYSRPYYTVMFRESVLSAASAPTSKRKQFVSVTDQSRRNITYVRRFWCDAIFVTI